MIQVFSEIILKLNRRKPTGFYVYIFNLHLLIELIFELL